MSISEEFSQQNQEIILKVLQKNDRPLSLLELKKKTALANLYFFKGLRALERNKIIQKIMKEGKTWVLLRD